MGMFRLRVAIGSDSIIPRDETRVYSTPALLLQTWLFRDRMFSLARPVVTREKSADLFCWLSINYTLQVLFVFNKNPSVHELNEIRAEVYQKLVVLTRLPE